jgi:glycosyltransferase involved in cell wall biosynthesis
MMRDEIGHYLVVAIIEENGNRRYDSHVHFTIDQHYRASYLRAANFLNQSDVDVVSIQHEFGIFGGDWGRYVLDLYRNLRRPIVTTFHTVLSEPSDEANRIVTEIAELSEAVVVTIESAADLLRERVGISSDKVKIVHHGAALPEHGRRSYAKRFLGLQKRTVLATCGLISSGKGIEHVITALPRLVKERPDLLYLVIGETHPEVRKHEGEAYRQKLISLTNQLHLEDNVQFVDRYLPDDELSVYLQAVDLYVAPYLGKDQVSSGTLTLALGHGKAIVATPTLFAKEVLSGERGIFCEFADSNSIMECMDQILSDPKLKLKLETNAFKYGQEVGWTKVAEQYGELLRSAIGFPRTVDEASAISKA